jgi:predicted DNA-binding ArsR family transcriptional regulator
MHSIWIKGFKGDAKEKRITEVMNYRNAFEDLSDVIEQTLQRKDAVRDYSPGWAEKQIAVNEYNAALDDILNLIDLNRKDRKQ